MKFLKVYHETEEKANPFGKEMRLESCHIFLPFIPCLRAPAFFGSCVCRECNVRSGGSETARRGLPDEMHARFFLK